jgi:hypothetical protein
VSVVLGSRNEVQRVTGYHDDAAAQPIGTVSTAQAAQ